MNLQDLKKPFSSKDIEWRVSRSGMKNGKPWAKVLAYVTNRAIMDRLDDVVGPEFWRNNFVEGPSGGVLCGISIYSEDLNGWITKWDGSENTDIESVKGGLSGSMKRAAVQWGIGRYLYRLEEGWAQFSAGGSHSAKIDGQYYNWSPPALPAWALPEGEEVVADNPIDDIPAGEGPIDPDYPETTTVNEYLPNGDMSVNYVMKMIDDSKLLPKDKTAFKQEAMKKSEKVLEAWVKGFLTHRINEANSQEEIF